MSDDKENLVSKSKRGRKPKVNPEDVVCRFCGVDLRIKFGSGFKSFVNIFNQSQREEFQCVFADRLRTVGFHFENKSHISQIICLPCARKANSFCQFYELLNKAASQCPDSCDVSLK